MSFLLLPLLAAAIVLALAYAGIGRPYTFAMVAFFAIVAGGVLLVASPTPPGYAPALDADRPFDIARVGPQLSGVLFAIGAASLLAAAGFRRRSREGARFNRR